MALRTVDRTFLQGQSVDLFYVAIKSQATCDPYERRLIGFLKRMDTASPDVVEAVYDLTIVEVPNLVGMNYHI
jgi:hypothetical protein